MRVTKSVLRDMILAEMGAVDEDAVVPRSPARGVPGRELSDMSTEEVELVLSLKPGGKSAKMADFINAMVKAGWDRDDFTRTLAGMDDDVLLTLLAPAMRESYHRAVQLLAGAIGAPDRAVDGNDGTLMTVGQFRRLVSEALEFYPEFSKFPEGWQPGPLEQRLDETTLMTVGQFRRLVRETAGGGGDEDRVRWKANSIAMANEIADTLISSGPLPNYGNILDALAKHVYRKQGLTDFIDFRSEMMGLQDKEIFNMWIENLDDPGDDLQMLQMALARDIGDDLQLDEGDSVTMTLGRFRRVIREASYDWDPFDPISRRAVAGQLIIDTKPGEYSTEDWEDLLGEYLTDYLSPQGDPEPVPETEMMANFEAATATAAEGLVNPDILKVAMLNMLSGDVDEGGDVMGQYTAGSAQMAGAQSKASKQSGKAKIGASTGRSQAQSVQDEFHRIQCKSPPDIKMKQVGESSPASDDETDEECIRLYEDDLVLPTDWSS